MLHRYLEPIISELCYPTDKMAFISGPRQCGKTTMAKMMLKERGEGAYYNWDEVKFRRLWTKDPLLVIPESNYKTKPLIILDELHKAKLWKRSLKGLYDSQNQRCDIMVTGSARLNIYRRGSDSLMGRYYHFKLHPLSFAEVLNKNLFCIPSKLIDTLFSKKLESTVKMEEIIKKLFEFGPFPEPYLSGDKRILNLWRRGRVEKIIREDLRDLSRLPELSQVEMLASLLPERASKPLSIQSLSEDIEVSYTTIKRWINYLKELYYIFSIKPYSKSLPRSIKKESKIYLWDWSEIDNEGARFENMIASHLLKYCDYLNDSGMGNYEINYLRNKEKQEIDFLITENNKPWLPIEVKTANSEPNATWQKFMKYLKCPYGLQVVMKPNIHQLYTFPEYKILSLSADKFLRFLI